jgi:hypothetical protein
LNWATPDDKGRYDIEAIRDLNPKYIFVVCDTSGGGGSDLFLTWIFNYVSNIDKFMYKNDSAFVKSLEEYDDKEKVIFEQLSSYKILESTYRPVIGKGTFDTLVTRYIILVKLDIYPNDYPQNGTQKIELEPKNNDHQECIIC